MLRGAGAGPEANTAGSRSSGLGRKHGGENETGQMTTDPGLGLRAGHRGLWAGRAALPRSQHPLSAKHHWQNRVGAPPEARATAGADHVPGPRPSSRPRPLPTPPPPRHQPPLPRGPPPPPPPLPCARIWESKEERGN